jgi:hypothetical protein
MPRHPEVGAAKVRKMAGKDERRAKVAVLRVEAFEEWNGDCAVCWYAFISLIGPSPSPATDLHHVLSGPERRLRESAETVLPVCGDHHRWLHRGDLPTLELAREACDGADMMEAVRALDRRIAKVHEARGSAARAERERSGQ